MGAFIGAILVALVIGIWAAVVFGTDNAEWALWMIPAFFVGFFIVMMVMTVVDSAVVTIFVCFAEDPDALKHSNMQLYTSMMNAWNSKRGNNSH